MIIRGATSSALRTSGAQILTFRSPARASTSRTATDVQEATARRSGLRGTTFGATRWYATKKRDVKEREEVDVEEPEASTETILAEEDEQELSLATQSKATLKLIEKLKSKVIPDPTQPIAHLPSRDEWPSTFLKTPGLRKHRWFIANTDTCQSVVNALGLDKKPQKCKTPTTIVEGYAGPGVMTRTFLNAPGVEKVVAIEQDPVSQKGLQNLQNEVGEKRLSIVSHSAFHWGSYDEVLKSGSLDHLPHVCQARQSLPTLESNGYFNDEAWLEPSPLLFFAQLPSTVHSEQLLSQLLRAIAHRLWLWRFGRVRLALMCSEQIAERIQAPLGSRLRGKFTTIVEATSSVQILKHKEDFIPSSDHFFPPTLGVGSLLPSTTTAASIKSSPKKLQDLSSRENQCLVLIEPRIQPLVAGDALDTFDYVTKNLFVLRSTPVRKAMSHLAAGAENILRRLDGAQIHPALADIGGAVEVDPDTKVMDLTIEQLVAISRIFDRWPFRPEHLFDEGNLEEVMKRKSGGM